MKKSGIIIVLVILISFISLAQEPGKLYINDILIPYGIEEKCTDGTLYGQCSSEKPKYCNNGVLVDNCVLCSCDVGECQLDDGSCKGVKPEKKAKSTYYVYANGQRIAKVENNEVYYFHNDHLGSPRVITDSNGNVVEEINYLPFGESFERNEKISYNSKELDFDTKLNYYGARYYNAPVGRFITADTVKGSLVDPQSLNLYVYTLNNPLKYVDPSGNQIMTSMPSSGSEISDQSKKEWYSSEKKHWYSQDPVFKETYKAIKEEGIWSGIKTIFKGLSESDPIGIPTPIATFKVGQILTGSKEVIKQTPRAVGTIVDSSEDLIRKMDDVVQIQKTAFQELAEKGKLNPRNIKTETLEILTEVRKAEVSALKADKFASAELNRMNTEFIRKTREEAEQVISKNADMLIEALRKK